MADFDYLSNNFKAYAEQKLNSLESEFTSSTVRDSDIDALERALKQKVENTKQDLSDRIDEVQNTITNRRPHPSDPDYARKRAQYVELLSQSVNGMDLLKAWLQNIFNQLKQIVMSIIGWIANKIIGLARRIKDAFQSLLQIFF
ncbi:unnamed protein product [Adineta ricciae]|uniref:Uncharacterized protein n=1 Tax=Adineta ricciae TaxID=249248 RepID=A0A815LU98_ADIRI|nr:unnamed protein product [Adineta ricciae]CAF1431433.1 unnamed protein product [Adineta ricciae]